MDPPDKVTAPPIVPAPANFAPLATVAAVTPSEPVAQGSGAYRSRPGVAASTAQSQRAGAGLVNMGNAVGAVEDRPGEGGAGIERADGPGGCTAKVGTAKAGVRVAAELTERVSISTGAVGREKIESR